jgi:large subunit ribosomal protein L4
MPAVPVFDRSGTPVETLELRPEVFGVEVRAPLLHQAVTRELADRRAGTHATKGRSDVSGGGRKPWRQKGTGRARQGSIRATQWKGGGKPFGPHPRSYAQAMPRRARREALRAALTDRVAGGQLKVVERVELTAPKTRELAALLTGFGLAARPALLVVAKVSRPLALASRNLQWLTVETPRHVSVYQLLRHEQLLFERDALLSMQDALAK